MGKAEKAEVKTLLEDIRAKVKSGEDFCKYAEQYSEDPGSKQFCGELGFFKRGELVPEYETAALKLKPGELSEVVLSEYGFHLIQLIERRSNEFNTRHILIKPKSSEKDIDNAFIFLDSLRTAILSDSIPFSRAANKYSEDKKTQSSGGFLTDEAGNYRMSVDNVDPSLFFTIDTMQVGEITPPVKFKMEDGAEAVRIIYLKAKLSPHRANLKDDYQEIYNAAVEHKKNSALNSWFDKTKGEVFIQIDEAYSGCNILVNP
jgi:peptidyl-prolyl cis-trans isomerase SurA